MAVSTLQAGSSLLEVGVAAVAVSAMAVRAEDLLAHLANIAKAVLQAQAVRSMLAGLAVTVTVGQESELCGLEETVQVATVEVVEATTAVEVVIMEVADPVLLFQPAKLWSTIKGT